MRTAPKKQWMVLAIGLAAIGLAGVVRAEDDETGERLDGLDERLTYLEDDIESILGVQDRLLERLTRIRLNWSGSYRSTVDNFHLRDQTVGEDLSHLDLVLDDFGQPVLDPKSGTLLTSPVYTPTQRDVDDWYEGSWVNRLRLTMTYDVSDNLRFYGTLVVYKYFNELKSHPVTLDMHSSRYPRDSTVRLERAYFDWFITDWLVASVGRVAAAEGPPAELKENTVRSATWGVQMVEAEMETAMLTIHLSRLLAGTYLRVFYIPFINHDDFDIADDLKLFTDGGIQPMHAFGAMLEAQLPFLGNNLWQLGGVLVPQFRPRNISIRVPGLAEPLPPSTPTSQNLGRYGMATGLMELKDVLGLGLDLFAAYTMTFLQPSEGRMVYKVPVALDVVNPATGKVLSRYEGVERVETGLASYEEGTGTTNLGHLVYAGARFTFPFFDNYAPRLGFEANRGTKYHIAWATPSDLLVNKLATKGWAFEGYYTQQLIPEHLFARVGVLHVIREYEGLYIGPTTQVDQKLTNIYVLLDASW